MDRKKMPKNIIRITEDTWLKQKTVMSSKLEDGKEKIRVYADTEIPVMASLEEGNHLKITIGVTDRAFNWAGRNTWYVWKEHYKWVRHEWKQIEVELENPAELAERIAHHCESIGHPLPKNKYNLVGIAGWCRDKPNDNIQDLWNDTVAIIAWDGSQFKFVCSYVATVEPGTYYTENPMNKGGCAVIDYGYHAQIWAFGTHKGYEALQQVGKVRLIRDKNRDGKRNDVVTTEMWNGINLHSTSRNYNGGSIGRFSAGCVVIRNWDDFESLKHHLRQSPQYKASRNCRFDFWVFPYSDLLNKE